MAFLAKLNRYLHVISGISLAFIILVTVADVLSANLRGRPMTGVYEAVEAAMVYMVFLGIPETFRNEQNITVDICDHFLSQTAVAVLRCFGAVVSVAYLGLLEWSMIRPALDAWKFGDYKADSGIPFWIIWIPILLGTAMAIVASVVVMRRVLAQRGRSEPAPSEPGP
ncbi:MAG TPA: TRAP transporter small permease [Xanthobacteraceae bacterium]|jgi:TRAP-type C4-dicarboxylate transport system permease small subunit|nr:TRAP transporter small permease [Xanthobacteraceae bacterium]